MKSFKEYVLLREKLGIVENADIEAEKIYEIVKDKMERVPYYYVYKSLISLEKKKKETKIKFKGNISDYKLNLSGEEYEGLNLDLEFQQSPAIFNPMNNGKLLGLYTQFGQIEKRKRDKRERVFSGKNPQGDIDITIRIGINTHSFMHDVLKNEMKNEQRANFLIKTIVLKNFEENEQDYISSISHELAHNLVFKKRKEKGTTMRSSLDYTSFMFTKFPIQAIESIIYNMYFIHSTERHVYPTEIYSVAKQMGIEKKNFINFLKDNRIYKNLSNIKEDTYEKFISRLKSQIKDIDNLLNAVGMNSDEMNEDEKINSVINVAYRIILSNMEQRGNYIKNIIGNAENVEDFDDSLKKELRPYQTNPENFFKKKIASMSRVADNEIKRISKIYEMLP